MHWENDEVDYIEDEMIDNDVTLDDLVSKAFSNLLKQKIDKYPKNLDYDFINQKLKDCSSLRQLIDFAYTYIDSNEPEPISLLLEAVELASK